MRTYEVHYAPLPAHLIVARQGEALALRTLMPMKPNVHVGWREAGDADYLAVKSEVGRPNVHDHHRWTKLLFDGRKLFPDFSRPDGEHMLFVADDMVWSADKDWHGSAAVSDRASWMFMSKLDGDLQEPFNMTPYTHGTREHRHVVYQRERQNSVLMVCLPYVTSPLDDATVFVKWNKHRGYSCLHPFPSPMVRVQGSPSPKIFPAVVLKGPANIASATEPATIEVEIVNRETGEIDPRCFSTLYVEMISGYAPHTRCKLEAGRGSFRVMGLGLLPGEALRAKVGWRMWPGLAEIELPVVCL